MDDIRENYEGFMRGKEEINNNLSGCNDEYEKEFGWIVYYNKLFDKDSIMYSIYHGEEECKEKYGSLERELVNMYKILAKLFIKDNSPYGGYIIFDQEKCTDSKDMNWWKRTDKEGTDIHHLNITDTRILASCLWLQKNEAYAISKLLQEIKPDYILDAFIREEEQGQLFNTADLHLYYIKERAKKDELGLYYPMLEHKVITLTGGFNLDRFIYSLDPESNNFLLTKYEPSPLGYSFENIVTYITNSPISFFYKDLDDFITDRSWCWNYDEAKKNDIDVGNVRDFICKYIKYILECKPEEMYGIGPLYDTIDRMYRYYSTNPIPDDVRKVNIKEM